MHFVHRQFQTESTFLPCVLAAELNIVLRWPFTVIEKQNEAHCTTKRRLPFPHSLVSEQFQSSRPSRGRAFGKGSLCCFSAPGDSPPRYRPASAGRLVAGSAANLSSSESRKGSRNGVRFNGKINTIEKKTESESSFCRVPVWAARVSGKGRQMRSFLVEPLLRPLRIKNDIYNHYKPISKTVSVRGIWHSGLQACIFLLFLKLRPLPCAVAGKWSS